MPPPELARSAAVIYQELLTGPTYAPAGGATTRRVAAAMARLARSPTRRRRTRTLAPRSIDMDAFPKGARNARRMEPPSRKVGIAKTGEPTFDAPDMRP